MLWLALGLALTSGAGRAGDLEHFTPRSQHGSAHLEVGCIDHRSLLFVVGHTEGEDPEAARLLAKRDCRPLVPGAAYARCGNRGLSHPPRGEPLPFSAYCRVGVADYQLYVLDLLMEPAVGNEARPD